MHYEHCGAGDAVLFIHGMPTSGRLWRGITNRLQERYTCFTIDLPGLGKSPQERYDESGAVFREPVRTARDTFGRTGLTAHLERRNRIALREARTTLVLWRHEETGC